MRQILTNRRFRIQKSLETGSLRLWCKVRLRGLINKSVQADFVTLAPILIGGDAGAKQVSLTRTDVKVLIRLVWHLRLLTKPLVELSHPNSA
jgi:hypothetical protein